METLYLLNAEIRQLEEIQKNGIFDISIDEITLTYTIGIDDHIIERKLSSENLQSFTENLIKSERSIHSITPNSQYFLEYFLNIYQLTFNLQTNLREYHKSFSFCFSINIKVYEVITKFSFYKSFFLDVIPLIKAQHFSDLYFKFSQEQLSYLYFVWRTEPTTFIDDFSFFNLNSIRNLRTKDFISFSDAFLSKNQKFPKIFSFKDHYLLFFKKSIHSLKSKSFFVFQFDI
jgi:hypothetical protein